MSQEKESIIYRVFESQRRHRNKKDWVTSVEKDLEELELNISFEKRKMTKYILLPKNEFSLRETGWSKWKDCEV